jgi:hypothetical protein
LGTVLSLASLCLAHWTSQSSLGNLKYKYLVTFSHARWQ